MAAAKELEKPSAPDAASPKEVEKPSAWRGSLNASLMAAAKGVERPSARDAASPKEDTEDLEPPKPYFVRFFTEPDTARGLMFGVALFYAGYAMHAYTCVIAVRSSQWALLVVTLAAVTVPCATHSVNTFFVLSIVQPQLSRRSKLKESALCLINLNRAVQARRFLKGTPPIWSLLFKDKLGHLTFGVLPKVTINLITLQRGFMEPFDEAYIALSTLLVLLAAAKSVMTVHKSVGPPGNMQKYRIWDIETAPYFHIAMMLIIDSAQVFYRAILFAAIGAILGIPHLMLTVLCFACACAALTFVGLSLIQAYDGFSALMSAITGLEDVLYDYTWLEPVPVYSFYIQVSYFLRVLQASAGVSALLWNWDDFAAAWEKPFVRAFLILGAVCLVLYLVAYPWYVYRVNRFRLQDAYMKRDEFVSNMMDKRKGRRSAILLHRATRLGLGRNVCDSTAVEPGEFVSGTKSVAREFV